MLRRALLIMAFVLPCLCSAQWMQQGADVDGTVPQGDFGNSVNMSGDGSRFVVGTPRGVFDSVRAVGLVRVFEWIDDSWIQVGSDLTGKGYGEFFGNSVAMSHDGSVIVVGVPCISISPTNPGYTVVYDWIDNEWRQRGGIIQGEDSSGVMNTAGLAVSVNADGSIIAIGATGNSNAVEYSGHVRVYKWNGTEWTQLGTDIDGTKRGETTGISVSLNARGDVLAIGATGAGIGGECRVYRFIDGQWSQMGSSMAGGEKNVFGGTVDLDTSGTVVAVSATSNTRFGTGYVKVFSWDGANWQQKGRMLEGDTATPDFLDFFGQAKLSADGNMLIAGAYGNTQSGGHAVVMRYDGSDWVMVSDTIRAKAATDFFGFSVDISSDGSHVIVAGTGSPGRIRVYRNRSVVNVDESVESSKPVTKIYPNPTNGHVYMKSTADGMRYRLVSMAGTIICSGISTGNESKIDVSHLSAGTYMLELQTLRGIESQLVVVR